MLDSWTGEWTQVFYESEFGHNVYVINMVVWDDRIWIIVRGNGRDIYHSANGTDWTKITRDPAVPTPQELLVFDDKLYVLDAACEIHDLSSGSFVEVVNWFGGTYWGSQSFDTDGNIIRIAGRSPAGCPQYQDRTMIWTYHPDTGISDDFTDENCYDDAPLAFDICFHSWTWFVGMHNYPGGGDTSTAARAYIRSGIDDWPRIDNGDLVCDLITPRQAVMQYKSTPFGFGAFISRFRYDNSGVWVDTDPVNQQRFDAVVEYYGYLIALAHGTGHVWSSTSKGNLWTDRGMIFSYPSAADYFICDWVIFNDQLYGGGGSDPESGDTRGRIWRLDKDLSRATGVFWPYDKPTSDTLKVDHEFGDTVYVSGYNVGTDPFALWIDDEFSTDDGTLIFGPSSGGSFIGVQTALIRDTVYVFGHFGTDDQIQVSANRGDSFVDCDDDWGEDKITTMEYLGTAGSDLGTAGSDLTITNYEDKDLLRTTSGLASWTKRGDIPGAPLSQIRNGDDIFVGCTAGSANLYLSTNIGQTYTVKGTGLPIDVDILDLELA